MPCAQRQITGITGRMVLHLSDQIPAQMRQECHTAYVVQISMVIEVTLAKEKFDMSPCL